MTDQQAYRNIARICLFLGLTFCAIGARQLYLLRDAVIVPPEAWIVVVALWGGPALFGGLLFLLLAAHGYYLSRRPGKRNER